MPLGTGRTPREALGLRAGLGMLVTRPPLRRVTVLTLLGAVELGALPVVAVAFGRDLHGTATAGAALTVAYGAGSLLGSALVTVWPLRGEPEVQAVRLFAAMAVATAVCALAPGYGLAVAGFTALGVANATSFTATLASRSAYAPEGAQAQVFVTSAGLKVAMAAVGAALMRHGERPRRPSAAAGSGGDHRPGRARGPGGPEAHDQAARRRRFDGLTSRFADLLTRVVIASAGGVVTTALWYWFPFAVKGFGCRWTAVPGLSP